MRMERKERIECLRQKIDSLDGEILSLLNKRAEIALELGKVKAEEKYPLYEPRREEEVLRRLVSINGGPFPERAVSSVFSEIISACRSLQLEFAVVYLGPAATYTHLACLQHFGNSVRALPEESIQEVFDAVERGKAEYGVVPIENSTEGVVNRTLDMFIESKVSICGEILTKISHDLLSQSGKPEGIRTIYSHPQAFGQCRQWVTKHFPHIQVVETVSTAKAAQMATKDANAAAIASSFAAHLYGLKVIESQIEDYLNNCTRFLVLGRQSMERTGRDKTSILFSIPHTPGSLYQALKIFSEKGVNLTKIESRPIKDKPWEYIFFLDLEGHAMDSYINEAITEIEGMALFMKLLGSYPRSS